jgi:hypothetical protein
MAYCHGCGAYVGDYSFYRHKMPGQGEMVLCYRCKRWKERHPQSTAFPKNESLAEGKKRVRTFSSIYIVSSLGLFAAGAMVIFTANRTGIGLIIVLGAISLLLVGRGMRKFAKTNAGGDIIDDERNK